MLALLALVACQYFPHRIDAEENRAADIATHCLFGPELPARYKHPSSIDELDNGDLYLVYYGGSGEYETDTAVHGARLAKGSPKWTRSRIIADTPHRSEGNAVIWQGPGKQIWLFYLTRHGDTWSTSRIKAKVSTDDDKAYPHRRNIATGPGPFAYPSAIQTRDGKIHVVYTTEDRTVIMHAVIDESAILKQP
jgi:predicted neuraminidase